MRSPDYYRSVRTGNICFRVNLPKGPKRVYRKGVDTGTSSYALAKKIVAETPAERLSLLAKASAITAETIALVTEHYPLSIERILAEYELWVPTTCSHATAITRICYARAFCNYIRRPTALLAKVTEAELLDWVHHNEPLAGTVRARLATLRPFFAFAKIKGSISCDISQLVRVRYEDLKMKQLEPRVVYPFTEAEYQLAISKLPEPYRTWLILCYCLGLRKIDVIRMEWASIKENSIVLYPQKSAREKRLELPLSNPLIGRPELIEALDRLRSKVRPQSPYIWPQQVQKIGKVESCYFTKDLSRKLNRMGIKDRAYHSARRSFMIRLEEAGTTLEQIAKLVGHSSTAMTQHYIASRENLPKDVGELEMAAMG